MRQSEFGLRWVSLHNFNFVLISLVKLTFDIDSAAELVVYQFLFFSPLIGIRYMATKVKSAREEEAILGLNVSFLFVASAITT